MRRINDQQQHGDGSRETVGGKAAGPALPLPQGAQTGLTYVLHLRRITLYGALGPQTSLCLMSAVDPA